MALQKRDPWGDVLHLQEQMNRLFDEARSRWPHMDGRTESLTGAYRPAIDLFEVPDGYVLRADLPGIGSGEFDVAVENGRLTLRGERRPDPGIDRGSFLRAERPSGKFAIEIDLPPTVDPARIAASHRAGVLEVRLPRLATEIGVGRIQVDHD